MSRENCKYHYFYKITNNINGRFYYGVHNTNDLNDGYMGSGVRLHYAYKKYGIENFSKEILKFFDTSKEAFEYEAEVVNEDMIKNPDCYNVQCGGAGWHTFGTIAVRDKDGNSFRVLTTDERYLSGELISANIGRIGVMDSNGNFFTVNTNDPRYLSGELKPRRLNGFAVFFDEKGNKYYLNVKDPKIRELKLKGHNKGKIVVKDKDDNFHFVDKTDPRYLLGEFKWILTDFSISKDSIEKRKNTYKQIKHQQGEKNSQFGTCWIHNDKESIKIKREQLEIYLNNGWIKGRKMKFE